MKIFERAWRLAKERTGQARGGMIKTILSDKDLYRG